MIEFLSPLLFLDGIFSDMGIVLKIFVLMAIFAYVTQHVGKGPLAILIILAMSYFIIFDYWKFLGGVYVLYILITLGIGGIIVDFMFITPAAHGNQPVSSGKDFVSRQAAYQKLRR